MGLSNCFHIYHFDLEVCKIIENFQAKLHVNRYQLYFIPFLSPTNAHGVRNPRPPGMWSFGALQGRSRECSCQKYFTSQRSTYLWLGFTRPLTPCLRTLLLKTKILSCQKEERNELLKQATAHSSEPLNKPSKM